MMQAPLELHRRLASRHYWQARLFYCGLGAAGLSLLAYLLGLGLAWHLGAVVVGALLGFVVRVRPSQPWALHWLDTHAGLSYRTALEHPESDAFGLHDALVQRAERGAKNVDQPNLQPWWLPLFALAFGLLLLPNLPWSLTSPFAPSPVVNDTAPLAAEEDLSDPAEADADRPDEVNTPSDPSAEDAEEPGTRGLDGDEAPAAAGDSSSPQDTPLDRDALEDFLRSLDESDSAEADTDPGGPPPDSPEETGPAQTQEQEGEPGGQERAEAGEQDEQGEQTQGEGEAASEADEGLAQEGEQEGPGEGEETREVQVAQEESEGEETATAGDEGEDEGSEVGDAVSLPGDGEGEGEDEGAFAEEPPGLEQGMGAGAEGAEADEEGVQEQLALERDNLQFLPGQRQDGEMSSGGVMRLPGTSEGEGPAGEAAGGFERGYERAITEGRIPVEYQEVLRDYFR